jgi:uncharacterized protein YjiS (DUF1127 family)
MEAPQQNATKAHPQMSTIETIGTDLATVESGAQRPRLASVLMTLVLKVEAMAERSRSRRALSALNEEQLKDIGLSRADAFREASRPFWI